MTAVVTLLQPATLGRQSLACGVQVCVSVEQALAWAATGIIAALPDLPAEAAPAQAAKATPANRRKKA